jgi:hypothetical protein
MFHPRGLIPDLPDCVISHTLADCCTPFFGSLHRLRGDGDLEAHLDLEGLPVRCLPLQQGQRSGSPRTGHFAGSQIVPYPEVFAGALIVTAPTLLVYIILGRWFVGGLMAGAVKS